MLHITSRKINFALSSSWRHLRFVEQLITLDNLGIESLLQQQISLYLPWDSISNKFLHIILASLYQTLIQTIPNHHKWLKYSTEQPGCLANQHWLSVHLAICPLCSCWPKLSDHWGSQWDIALPCESPASWLPAWLTKLPKHKQVGLPSLWTVRPTCWLSDSSAVKLKAPSISLGILRCLYFLPISKCQFYKTEFPFLTRSHSITSGQFGLSGRLKIM